MEHFAKQLRLRAKELGLSDAEVARRAGLNERRYGHYVTGEREPNLATLVRISEVLATTPNGLLGVAEENQPDDQKRTLLTSKLLSAANTLNDADLQIAISQVDALVSMRRNA